MNGDQKFVAYVAYIILGLMLLFPPYENCDSYHTLILKAKSYCDVDIPLLLIQWLCVIMVGGIAYFVEGNKNKNDDG